MTRYHDQSYLCRHSLSVCFTPTVNKLRIPAYIEAETNGRYVLKDLQMHFLWVRKVWCKFLMTFFYGIPIDVMSSCLDTFRPRQNGRYFPDDISKCIFLNGNVCISIKISMKFVSEGPINHITALVKIMARWRRDNKPLSEPVLVRLLTYISKSLPNSKFTQVKLNEGTLPWGSINSKAPGLSSIRGCHPRKINAIPANICAGRL